MESAVSSICKVCQGIFQEGHRRRIRLRQVGEHWWESEDSAYNQDIYSHSSGEHGQATTDPLIGEADDDASERYSDEEADRDTFEWSSEEDEDQHRPPNEEELDEEAKDDASKWSSNEEEELRRSSDEYSDEMANEDASEGPSDEEVYRWSDNLRDYFLYMHYPNLAMLQKSAEHCQSCHVLMHSLRSHNENLEAFLDQAQELEAQRLQKLQTSGDRAQSAILDEDECDPDLESALRVHVEVCDDLRMGSDWPVQPSLSPEEYGEGRLCLVFMEERLDHENIQDAKLDVFCKPILESSDSGHLESGVSFLASPVDDTDPALDHRPSEHILSETHIRLVRQWLGECQSQHTCCNDSRKGSWQPLPDRLIEISPIDEEGSNSIRLVETHKLQNKHVSYVCLSYCWGSTGNPSVTTTGNIAQYLENIALDQLPKTIRDAILLCLKLEFWYIWIDCLCIIQDDDDDWTNQAAQMSRIYSRAALTIATPICLDSSESFISKREEGNPLLALGIPGASLPIVDDSGKRYVLWLWAWRTIDFPAGLFLNQASSSWRSWETRKDTSTWIGRAWTFQEWLLSPRVLHISQFTLWDCLGGYANELNPRSMAKVRRQRNPEALGRDHFTWDLMLSEYTSRGITILSDKLPALAGIAKLYADTYQKHYLAGLWAEDLPLALLWRMDIDITTKKRNIEAPSWSWASVDEQVHTHVFSNAILDTCVLSYFCRYNPPDSYSTVLDAWIHLEGPLCVVSCDDAVKDPESVATLRLLTVPKNGEARRWKVQFDEDQNLDELKERIARRQVFNLLIYHGDPYNPWLTSHEALLLERLGEKQLGFDCYKRLGFCKPSSRLGRFDDYDPDYPSDTILEPERWGEVGAAWERTRVHLV